MRDDDAAAGEPKTPEYGTPTGADAGLPLYGSSDSVVPIKPSVTDFDPKAERRKKAQAARAAAAARTERARRVAREKKSAAAARANRARREAAFARTKDAHAAAARRRAERRNAAPSAWFVQMQRDRHRKFEETDALRQLDSAVVKRRARIAGLVVAAVLVVGVITTVVGVGTRDERTAVSASGLDWSGYPGYDGTEFEYVTEGRSQEEVIAADTAMIGEIRTALAEEAGLDWFPYGSDTVTAEKNAWDGPSLLNRWNSTRWYSTDAVTGVAAKRAVVDRVSSILEENGYSSRLLNDPNEFDLRDDLLEDLYGGTTLGTQVVWVLGADRLDGSLSTFELRITDLTLDDDGSFTERAQSRAITGEIPLNSVAIDVDGSSLLPADERDDYIERAEPFAGEDPPPAL
jgi:hypothetical protein